MHIRLSIRAAAMLLVVLFTIAAGPALLSSAAEIELNDKRFTLADDLTLELAAGPPLIDRPISADFDEQGRLYVSESSGSNDDVETQLKERPHRIVRLEDTDADGRFDAKVVFADRMMFPEGVLWHDGSVYVAAPPSIWKLTDTTGDGVADQREEWFDAKTLTGCANDLHGPYLGPDGWIYWCKGAFAKQVYPRENGPPLVTRAAHVFRRHPDGGEVEAVMTGGMDNPVELVFMSGGERIFCTTFLQHPAGGQRDGLIHAIYGGVYGKNHSVIDEHPRTGPVMPVMTHLGAAAPSGLARLRSDALGPGHQNALLTSLFNMQKVTRHVLRPEGATFASSDEDFLACDSIDFHPTDVLEDADGSVLVIDTGGWYKLCCPSSQLWKPDVLGAIYRIRRKDGPAREDARGLKLDWETTSSDQLITRLDDSRPAVRKRATQTLAKRGSESIPHLEMVLTSSSAERARLAAVWTLTRIDESAARAAVRSALKDPSETVRQAAIHSVSVWRDGEALPVLLDLVTAGVPHNRRAAAEAIGRIGDSTAVAELIEAASKPHDRVLEHSLIFAQIEIGDASPLHEALASANPHVRKACLMALDQIGSGHLEPADVAANLASDDVVLRDMAWWIATRHPEWGDTLSAQFRRLLRERTDFDGGDRELSKRLAPFIGSAAADAVLIEALGDDSTRPARRLAILDALVRSRTDPLSETWIEALSRTLISSDSELIGRAVAAVASHSETAKDLRMVEALGDLASRGDVNESTRIEALAALPSGHALADESLALLCRNLSLDMTPRIRALAADALLGAELSVEQLAAVADAMATTGISELNRLLAAFESHSDGALAARLLAALDSCPSTVALDPGELESRLSAFGEPSRERVAALIAKIESHTEAKRGQIEAVLAAVHTGDIRRGQQVYASTKAACTSCHAMGYLGGDAGPDLTRIGRIRSERDLAEAVLFPSASFVRSYEPITVVTNAGQIYNGTLRDESGHELSLRIDAEKIVRIAHDEIDIRQDGTVSIMPAGLDQQFTQQELVDLIVFLKASQ